MIFLVSLMAACLLGLGFVAQQHAAYREPLGEMLRVRLLVHLIRQPLWLAGIGLMFGGQLLGALALWEADVSRVEPLFATSLIFALAAAHIVYQEHLGPAEWTGAVLVSGGVALFLAFGEPHGGRSPAPSSAHWVVVAITVVAAVVLVLAGLRRSLPVKAMLLAASAGILYGLQDVLTRSSLLTLRLGPGALATSWEPYVIPCVAVVGLLLNQSAFDAAPLRISLPATTAAEPITGIVLGIVIFAERLELSAWALAAEVIGLIAMVTGIVLLGRSRFLVKSGAGDR
ncbi:DMT family transporter [Sphaerisporangium aureirubrum]|uniref:DMT family transporter n=1 Tax=Sphaerisporangium aureirubrum TaxID=1544736 RepID=A0ABW1NJB0_9ACTN